MNSNHKLSKVIAGRKILAAEPDKKKGLLKITFDDDSKMEIKTGDSGHLDLSKIKGMTVAKVQQQETTLRLIGDDAAAQDISLKEEGSSVLLRDRNNGLEYAD